MISLECYPMADINVDYSIVNYCISLPSASEASEYLSQYLLTLPGVSEPKMQAFKAEFVRRKEQVQSDSNLSSSDLEETDTPFGMNGTNILRTKSGMMDLARLLKDEAAGDSENVSSSMGGKKKGKKGKKVVDPSLLGFSVTSNRIMMGEIQHVDD